jgi:hypothetical protein
MKKCVLLFFLFVFWILHCANSQTPGEWVWLRGDMLTNNPGSFGIQGVSSAANEPPSLYEACEWTDLNGNFWLFGGLQGGGIYSDLWKYDPVINEWTWIKGPGVPDDAGNYGIQGVPSILNNPPCRSYGINSWVDVNGNLWMFGGAIFSGSYCDLWKYEIGSNEWTWMKGPNDTINAGVYGVKGVPDPANYPASRSETAASWTDNSGGLWLFGGNSYPLSGMSSYNDLWRYHISTNTWTWMTGSSGVNQPSVYGLKGVENGTNVPGARWPYAKWKDKNGNFWFWGGARWWNTQQQLQGDLWRFNPVTYKWTWMDGDTTGPGYINGTICNSHPDNSPTFPEECRATWIDANGNFMGYIHGFGIRNSMWMYCPASEEWSIIKADSLVGFSGSWGIKGISDPSNIPPQLAGPIGWTNDNEHFYMFGGIGGNSGQYFNALWMYTIDPCCAACNTGVPLQDFSATDTAICPGTCLSMINNSQSYSGYHWEFPGATPTSSNLSNPQNICYPNPGMYDITLIANGCNVTDTLTVTNYITVYPYPFPQGILQTGDTLFANQGAASYQWYFNGSIINGATNYFHVATSSGDYNVIATDANGCEVEAVINNVLAGLTAPLSFGEGSGVRLYPNPAGETLTVTGYQFFGTTGEISIYNITGESIYAGVFHETISVNCENIPSGVYWVEIREGEKMLRARFVKQ